MLFFKNFELYSLTIKIEILVVIICLVATSNRSAYESSVSQLIKLSSNNKARK